MVVRENRFRILISYTRARHSEMLTHPYHTYARAALIRDFSIIGCRRVIDSIRVPGARYRCTAVPAKNYVNRVSTPRVCLCVYFRKTSLRLCAMRCTHCMHGYVYDACAFYNTFRLAVFIF